MCKLLGLVKIFVVISSVNSESEQFEFQQVVNRVPGNTKHADPILSISDFSELPRRTPKKPLMTAEVNELNIDWWIERGGG